MGRKRHFKCSVCKEAFRFKLDFDIHKRRIHTGGKILSCQYCEKLFIHQGHLTVHERIHTREKPYSCDECDKSFSQKSNLKEHQQTHHRRKKLDSGHKASRNDSKSQEESGGVNLCEPVGLDDLMTAGNDDSLGSKDKDCGDQRQPPASGDHDIPMLQQVTAGDKRSSVEAEDGMIVSIERDTDPSPPDEAHRADANENLVPKDATQKGDCPSPSQIQDEFCVGSNNQTLTEEAATDHVDGGSTSEMPPAQHRRVEDEKHMEDGSPRGVDAAGPRVDPCVDQVREDEGPPSNSSDANDLIQLDDDDSNMVNHEMGSVEAVNTSTADDSDDERDKKSHVLMAAKLTQMNLKYERAVADGQKREKDLKRIIVKAQQRGKYQEDRSKKLQSDLQRANEEQDECIEKAKARERDWREREHKLKTEFDMAERDWRERLDTSEANVERLRKENRDLLQKNRELENILMALRHDIPTK